MSTFTHPQLTQNEGNQANQSAAQMSVFNVSDESIDEGPVHDATIDHTRSKRQRTDKDAGMEEKKQELEELL